MRVPTPLEVCKQIATEHAAGTLGAIAKERAAKLTDPLAHYAQKLSELAAANGERDQTEAPRARSRGSQQAPAPRRSLAD